MANRATVKSWFETGDKPTQQQFSTLFDSIRFLEDQISMADIAGLLALFATKADINTVNLLSQLIQAEAITIAGNDTYELPLGRVLQEIWIIPSADVTLRIGSFSGGEDVLPETIFETGVDSNVSVKVSALTEAKTLFIQFTGPAASTQLFIYKR